MRICRRSANSLALAAALGAVSASHGTPPPPTTHSDAAANAREALSNALEKARPHDIAAPALPRTSQDPKLVQSVANAAQHTATDWRLRDRAATDLVSAKAGMTAQSQAMSERLHQALGIDAPPASAMTQTVSTGPDKYVPLLFVSASMPIDELRTYAGQVEKTGGALAFRGMPGGLHRVAPMAELSARILRIDPGCSGPACRMRSVPIVVDPIAFRKAGVTAVPALAMVPGDPTTPYCERDDGNTAPDILVSGDAALTGLLDEYARLGGAKEVADAQAHLARR
jgi:hypothetical protein